VELNFILGRFIFGVQVVDPAWFVFFLRGWWEGFGAWHAISGPKT